MPRELSTDPHATRQREWARTHAARLPVIPLDAETADALLRLLDRTGKTRADLVRHLIRCADKDADPMA